MNMTQRERYLAIAVGAVLVLLLANMGFKSIRKELTQAENRVEKAQTDLNALKSAFENGQRAAIKIERLEPKSLPSNKDLAVSQYMSWLTEVANQVGVTPASVALNRTIPVTTQATTSNNAQRKPTEAFQIHEFTLTGKCHNEKVIELLALYYNREYLHRITKLTINREPKQANIVSLQLTTQAVSLAKAAADQKPSLQPSGRLAMNIDDYKKTILERNPFSLPNNPPKFETGRSHELTIDKPWSLQLQATDAEGDPVTYEMLTESEKLPEGLTMSRGEISWTPKNKGEKELLIRAIDGGWPRKSTDLKLTLKPVEAKVEVVEAPNTLDPAKQAFLTGLASGPTGAQGWILSKAEGRGIDITEGSEINIGSIKATVVKINVREDHVVLETEGSRWVFDQTSALADAWAKSKVD